MHDEVLCQVTGTRPVRSHHGLWLVDDVHSCNGRYGFLTKQQRFRRRRMRYDTLPPVDNEQKDQGQDACQDVADGHAIHTPRDPIRNAIAKNHASGTRNPQRRTKSRIMFGTL